MNPIKFLTRDRSSARTQSRVAVEKPLGQQVWEAPATFNRHTRRAYGILSRIWRWDTNASDDTRRTFVPRYVRRHRKAALDARTYLPTRRERRHRARIIKAMAWKGMKP